MVFTLIGRFCLVRVFKSSGILPFEPFALTFEVMRFANWSSSIVGSMPTVFGVRLSQTLVWRGCLLASDPWVCVVSSECLGLSLAPQLSVFGVVCHLCTQMQVTCRSGFGVPIRLQFALILCFFASLNCTLAVNIGQSIGSEMARARILNATSSANTNIRAFSSADQKTDMIRTTNGFCI